MLGAKFCNTNIKKSFQDVITLFQNTNTNVNYRNLESKSQTLDCLAWTSHENNVPMPRMGKEKLVIQGTCFWCRVQILMKFNRKIYVFLNYDIIFFLRNNNLSKQFLRINVHHLQLFPII